MPSSVGVGPVKRGAWEVKPPNYNQVCALAFSKGVRFLWGNPLTLTIYHMRDSDAAFVAHLSGWIKLKARAVPCPELLPALEH